MGLVTSCRIIWVKFEDKIDHLIKGGGEKPVVNQIEVHPMLWEGEAIEYCRKNEILVEAYSPLGHNLHPLMNNPLLK